LLAEQGRLSGDLLPPPPPPPLLLLLRPWKTFIAQSGLLQLAVAH